MSETEQTLVFDSNTKHTEITIRHILCVVIGILIAMLYIQHHLHNVAIYDGIPQLPKGTKLEILSYAQWRGDWEATLTYKDIDIEGDGDTSMLAVKAAIAKYEDLINGQH